MTTPIFGPELGGMSAAIVHQDRLVMVGSGAIPSMIVASRSGDWTDMAVGYTTDGDPVVLPSETSVPVKAADNGFWVQNTSGRGNAFHGLLQQEGMFIFGDQGESVVPAGAFTEDDVEVRENSWFGSERGRTPIIAGGVAVFLQAGGEDIRGIAWTEAEAKYIAQSLLTHAGAVFDRAVDMTFQISTGRHGDTVFVIDENGDMATMLLRVGAPFPAWSRWTLRENVRAPSQGDRVIGAAAPAGQSVFLVERNGEVGVETLEDTDWMDAVWGWTVSEGPGTVGPGTDADGFAIAPRWMWGRTLSWRYRGGTQVWSVVIPDNGRLNGPGTDGGGARVPGRQELGPPATRWSWGGSSTPRWRRCPSWRRPTPA